jgi:hypothetical protein
MKDKIDGKMKVILMALVMAAKNSSEMSVNFYQTT